MNTDIQLSDGLIVLRPHKISDASEINTAVRESLTELKPWMDWATDAYNANSARRWLEDVQMAWTHSSAFHFAITDAFSGEYLGGCGLDGIDEQKSLCNLGYWVRTSRTGRGIATRAARLAAEFAFETLMLSRVELLIAAPNTASQRAAQKAGAHYECTLTEGMVIHTDIYDALKFFLTPDRLESGK